MSAIRSKQAAIADAAKVIDSSVQDLNNRSCQYVVSRWRREFPLHEPGVSPEFALGSHTVKYWQPGIMLHGCGKLCLSKNGFWFDPLDCHRQVTRLMPMPKKIDEFCKRMSDELGVPVRFYRHKPPLATLLPRIEQKKKEVFDDTKG